jgi:hypothetical protein
MFFFKPKITIWVILEGLAMQDAGTFYDHFVYFTTIWYILWPFGYFMVIWHYISRFGIFIKKNLATIFGI